MWPQSGRRQRQAKRHPPPGLNFGESSGCETRMGMSLCLGQQRPKELPIESEARSRSMTFCHIGMFEYVSALPMIYIPCWARLRRTLIRFVVFRNPTFFSLLLLTRDTMTTLGSSPWKLSTVAIRKSSISFLFFKYALLCWLSWLSGSSSPALG